MKSLREKLQYSSPILFEIAFDIVAITISYIIHYYIRFESGLFDTDIHPSFVDAFITGTIILLYWLIAFFFAGLYRNWFVRSPFDEFFAVIKTSFFFNFLLFFFVFLDSSARPRLLFLIYFIDITFFVLLGRFLARRLQKYLRQKKIIQVPVVVLGTTQEVLDLMKKVQSYPEWGFDVRAIILLSEEDQSLDVGVPIYKFSDLEKVLEKYHPRELFIAIDKPNHEMLLEIANKCAERQIVVKIVPDLYDVLTGLVKTFPMYSIPLIEISTQLLRPWEAFLKRFLDIVISLFVLIVGLPLWIIVAILIKLDSKGPILYKQERVGKNGKIFICYKFRSMYVDAEKTGPKTTVLNDPRVTRVGLFLRKTHIDEVPQFWNVLKGEMSLVGPRPERPVFIEMYSKMVPLFKRRLVVRPGITGWNQVKSPLFEINEEHLKNRLKDDFYYIENMSLKLDIEIILRTIYLVLRGRGQA
ncbi:MAG: Undecaprenyl-phosphate galactosephosphotransferase [Candidatus Kapaibacterium sp.]|nr:MAG: Undecaprenyl-phosphate galactosephosphotransferase [Candidatus Kapabacteria bacterium]